MKHEKPSAARQASEPEATWNSPEAIAQHRAMSPEQRLRKAIALSQAALRFARAPINMDDVTDVQGTDSREPNAGPDTSARPLDESRLAMMRRVKALSIAERIDLLDRICREQTQIAVRARRVR